MVDPVRFMRVVGKILRTLISSIGSLWCRLMHDDLMHPIHGHYQCRRCLRYRPVPWEKDRSSVK
jgi:hypothetical protein